MDLSIVFCTFTRPGTNQDTLDSHQKTVKTSLSSDKHGHDKPRFTGSPRNSSFDEMVGQVFLAIFSRLEGIYIPRNAVRSLSLREKLWDFPNFWISYRVPLDFRRFPIISHEFPMNFPWHHQCSTKHCSGADHPGPGPTGAASACRCDPWEGGL